MQEVFDRIIAQLENMSFMDDYDLIIGLDDAIEIIHQAKEEYSKTPTPDHPIPIDTQMYIQELERKVSNNEWIPADEPPKDNKYVLLSFANFSVPAVGRYEEDPDGGGAYYLGDEEETLLSQDMIVNAWMPLPEPYRD